MHRYQVLRRLARDRGAVLGGAILFALVVSVLLAPSLSPHDPYDAHPRERLELPSAEYPLGTDEMGRCILSRILYGGRLSLQIGFTATGVGVLSGVFLGLVAGFYPSLDNPVMRLMDIMMAIPSILLSLAIVTVLGPGIRNLTVAVGVGLIPTFARVTRSSVLSAKEQNYVEAARAAGSPDLRILFAHVLPNCAPPLIVYSTFYLGTAILTASTLSFLGFGVQPPYAEWGAMASAGRTHFLVAPHVSTFPSLAIFVTILALNLLGDGLRDVLDPRLKD